MTKSSFFAIASVLLLPGCSSAADEALESYEGARKFGTNAEICEATRQIAKAYRTDGNREKDAEYSHQAAASCAAAAADLQKTPAANATKSIVGYK